MSHSISDSEIIYILENPWEKSRDEWLLANEAERLETLEYIHGLLRRTEDNGYVKLWKTAEEKPIALLGAFLVAEKRYETFLICSHHMGDHSIKVSFDMRKILKELSLKYKGCILSQYAHAGRSDQISWFRFIGFKHKPEADRGNIRYFEYASPSD